MFESIKEGATGGVLYKKLFLKISQILQENTLLESLSNKVAGLQAATLLKKDSNTGIFLWDLKKN